MDHTPTMRRFYDRINAGDIDGFGRQLAEDFVEREDMPGIAPNKAGTIQFFQMLTGAFPDLRMVAQDVISSGDKAVARVLMTGTHKGPFMGMAATGKRIEVKLIDIIRFGDDGRALEHWGVFDQFVMMQQLGAIPEGSPK